MPSEDRSNDPLEAALAEFHEAWDKNKNLDLEAFLKGHPECGPELRAEIERVLFVLGGMPESMERESKRPERIGRFRILQELGRGGQGSVYLAEDEKLHRQVALKVLPSEFELTSRLLERFKREAEAASRLDHPGICSVFETGEEEDLHYIVMRYVEGESLANMIAGARKDPSRFKGGVFETSGPDKEDTDTGKRPSTASKRPSTAGSGTHGEDAVMRSVHCIEKAAMAVHAAHEAGIIHRDIKPGNIMITPDGDPVILDFGLARLEESGGFSLTRSTDILGTPAYMSPEQIRGDRKRVNLQTDVYSLAATLVECLTLRPPFQATTREGLYRAILTEAAPGPRSMNPKIPTDLAVILQTALAKNPDHRFKSALDFAEELRRVRQHEPIMTRRAGPLLRLWRWSQRNPKLAAALAGIFIVLALGFAISAYQFGKTQFELREKERNADIWQLPYLEQQAEEGLWPALPHKVKDMESWLEKAEKLYSRLDVHRQWVEEMKNDLALQTDHPFTEEVSRMEAHIEQLSRFGGIIDDVKKRYEWAATIEEKTVGQYRDKWNATIEAIADENRNPQYKGLRIKPKIGLIPLGQDPESGLFEFSHLQTGDEPRRDTDTGRFKITEETGLVFVLLPGDTFKMGSLPVSEVNQTGDPYVDPGSTLEELVLHVVKLDPFYLSKYEMTQGQWLRFTGHNPAYYSPGSIYLDMATGADLRFPVESVSWDECVVTLRKLGMTLPREAQWEYACRAGTSTPWYTGDDCLTLQGYENIADEGSKGDYVGFWECTKGLNDGYMLAAPVGSFKSNPFGLHDMIGNVTEWCNDRWVEYMKSLTVSGDGERIVNEAMWTSRPYICRGGNFRNVGQKARSATRSTRLSKFFSENLGLRPAMPVDRDMPDGEPERSIPPDEEGELQAKIDEADRFYAQEKYSDAKPLYRQIVEDHVRYLGKDHLLTVAYRTNLAWTLLKQGKYTEAEPHYRQIHEIRARFPGEEEARTLFMLECLAWCLHKQGRYAEAELPYRKVYHSYLRFYGGRHERTMGAWDTYSIIVEMLGKYVQAEQLNRQFLEIKVRELGEMNPMTIRPRNYLGWPVMQLGRPDEAEPLFRKNMKIGKSQLGEEHLKTLAAMTHLAMALSKQGRLSEAKTLIDRAVELRRRTLGENHKITLVSEGVLADVLMRQGKLSEAESLHNHVIEKLRQESGDMILYNFQFMKSLAQALVKQEKFSEAETLLGDTVRLADELLVEESLERFPCHMDYGKLLLDIERFSDAEHHLAIACEGYRKILGEEHPFTQESLQLLVDLYLAWGKPEEADTYRSMLSTTRRPAGEK